MPGDRAGAFATARRDPEVRDGLQLTGADSRPSHLEPGSQNLPTAILGERLVLSVAEAGELLGLSRAFAYELVARGELPVVRFGRRIVVPKAALLELLASAASSA